MRVALIQMDIAWGDVRQNILSAEQLVDGEAADLYVLPEMWATGYSVHPERIAENEESSMALQWMKRKAAEKHCALCGSLAIRDGEGRYVNRHYFVDGSSVNYYDKHHLFSYAHEDVNYTAGQRHVVVACGGLRLLLQTCYDLRFPVWSRYGMAGEYDAIVYVANWPEARQDAWDTLLRARAIENQCYVIGVNRVGMEKKTRFTGGSVVIDPLGHQIVSCESCACTRMALLHRHVVDAARQAFPALDDRDEPGLIQPCMPAQPARP